MTWISLRKEGVINAIKHWFHIRHNKWQLGLIASLLQANQDVCVHLESVGDGKEIIGYIPCARVGYYSRSYHYTTISSGDTHLAVLDDDTFALLSIGWPTYCLNTYLITKVQSHKPDAETLIQQTAYRDFVNRLAVPGRVMHDEEALVFTDTRGVGYFVTAGFNKNQAGFTAYNGITKHAVFIHWDFIEKYAGVPASEYRIQPRGNFVYYDWMGDQVRNKQSITVSRQKEPHRKKTLDLINELDTKIKQLKKLVRNDLS